MKRIMTVLLSMALAVSVIAAQAQQGTAGATTAKSPRRKAVAKKAGPTVSDQLSEMKLAIDAQQAQIRQLSDLFDNLSPLLLRHPPPPRQIQGKE